MAKVLRIWVLTLLMVGIASVVQAAAFHQGDYGDDVSAIQSRLNSLGYAVTVDGDFGPATAQAVKSFQAARGLQADGVIGSQTYRALMGRDIPVSRGGESTAAIRRIIQNSFAYMGVPYYFGGTSPRGFDCSGFTQYVFANSGIHLPRTADAQYEIGRRISYSRLQPGDLVFFTTYAYGASHVGIYLGGGKFISATSSRGVAVADMTRGYWGERYIGARRIG